MKTRALAIAAMCGAMGFAAVAMDAPTRVVVAEEAKKEAAYKTAEEVLASITELSKTAFKNPRSPSKAESTAFYTEAFSRIAAYLNANPAATDSKSLYDYAFNARGNSFGFAEFVTIADSYLKANPNAEDAGTWKEFSIFASIGNPNLKAAGEKALAALELEGQKNVISRFTAMAIKYNVANNTNDNDAKKTALEAISKDKEVLGITDTKINRRLMRLLLPQTTVKIVEGQAFPDWSSVMTVCDLDSKPISVADYKGKYLLIDFWATWCGPCIGETPNVVKLYNEFNKAGFEVVGISCDRENQEQQLRDTIAGKGKIGARTGVMPWRQIFDGAGSLASRFEVNGIPHTVLIDKEGKVIAIGLRGPELEAKIKELFGSSKSENKSGEAKPADDGSKKF